MKHRFMMVKIDEGRVSGFWTMNLFLLAWFRRTQVGEERGLPLCSTKSDNAFT